MDSTPGPRLPTLPTLRERIERKSLAAQLADGIEKEIRSGTWSDLLPGNRTLAERFRVSRKTCAVAMKILEQRRLIEPAEVGKRRKIRDGLKREAPADSETARLLILLPSVARINFEDEALLRSMQEIWEGSMGSVVWERVDYARYKKPAILLENLISRHQVAAVVLFIPLSTWGMVAAERLPSFQLGGMHGESSRFSLCLFAITQGIEMVSRYLASLGHRRLLIPIDSINGGFRSAFVDGLAKGLGQAAGSVTIEDMCPSFPEPVPEVWRSYWDKAFRRIRPTAVVVTEDVHLLSLYGYCADRGIRIPHDLSVISANYQENFEWCKPRPTMLKFPNRKAVALFKDWLAGGLHPIGKHFLQMETVEGESVARAPAED